MVGKKNPCVDLVLRSTQVKGSDGVIGKKGHDVRDLS